MYMYSEGLIYSLINANCIMSQDKEPRGIIPLENLEVRNVAVEKKNVSQWITIPLVSSLQVPKHDECILYRVRGLFAVLL